MFVGAQIVVGMVEADAAEVLMAGYLKHVAREQGIEFPARARMVSVAVWQIAKAALVRDAATGACEQVERVCGRSGACPGVAGLQSYRR